jgi:drug/metabolite transporter (DMT)-like permease
MSAAIIYALLSLAFGGLIEIVFKRYSAAKRSRGMMICGVGVVWAVLLTIDLAIRGDTFLFVPVTWKFGLIAGIAVATANILLLESLRHMEVSLGSTIYRLNTIVVVLLAVIFLGESMSLFKLAGVACGVFAVLLLYQQQHSAGTHFSLNTGLILVIFGALLRAVYGVVTKAGLSAGADADALILISALCWIVSGGLYALIIERRYAITRAKLIYSLVAGILAYAIIKTLVTALSLGEASVVVTIANMSFLMSLLVALLLKIEALSPKKIAAMFFAISAITLLSYA